MTQVARRIERSWGVRPADACAEASGVPVGAVAALPAELFACRCGRLHADPFCGVCAAAHHPEGGCRPESTRLPLGGVDPSACCAGCADADALAARVPVAAGRSLADAARAARRLAGLVRLPVPPSSSCRLPAGRCLAHASSPVAGVEAQCADRVALLRQVASPFAPLGGVFADALADADALEERLAAHRPVFAGVMHAWGMRAWSRRPGWFRRPGCVPQLPAPVPTALVVAFPPAAPPPRCARDRVAAHDTLRFWFSPFGACADLSAPASSLAVDLARFAGWGAVAAPLPGPLRRGGVEAASTLVAGLRRDGADAESALRAAVALLADA